MKRQPLRKAIFLVLLVVAAAALLWAMIAVLRPFPDRHLSMATGPPGSTYAQFGERYREILARDGVELRLVPTNGAVDNVKLLSDLNNDIDVGFVQAGSVDPALAKDLVSLGTLFYEPVWFFCRCNFSGPPGFAGLRTSIGPDGSADRPLALKLLALNGIDAHPQQLYSYSPQRAAEALLAGQIDAVFLASGWDSPAVQALARAPDVNVIGFPRADAYVTLDPRLSKLILPRGVADLAHDKPPQDTPLIASKASLAVHKHLHPALQYLLVQAAIEVHSRAGIFERAGAFPAAEEIDLPVSAEARHIYKEGPSILQRYLPFWLAELVTRLLVVLLPLVGIIYPLWSLAPKIYHWQLQRRINQIYGELRRLEFELRLGTPGLRDSLLARLDALDQRALNLRLPKTFGGVTYQLKAHIQLLRERASASA
jgi:TRAP-type uncharacterized transport system substrate-binding protein